MPVNIGTISIWTALATCGAVQMIEITIVYVNCGLIPSTLIKTLLLCYFRKIFIRCSCFSLIFTNWNEMEVHGGEMWTKNRGVEEEICCRRKKEGKYTVQCTDNKGKGGTSPSSNKAHFYGNQPVIDQVALASSTRLGTLMVRKLLVPISILDWLSSNQPFLAAKQKIQIIRLYQVQLQYPISQQNSR